MDKEEKGKEKKSKPRLVFRTHGDLALMGLLPSLAKNLHRLDISKIKVGKPVGPSVTLPESEEELTAQEAGNKVIEQQIRVIEDMLADFRLALSEGIAVSEVELKLLENRLSWLLPKRPK